MPAQQSYAIKKIQGINTELDDIACGISGEEMLYMSARQSDLVNDYTWNFRPMFQLMKAKRGETFEEWKASVDVFERKGKGDEGPAAYDVTDSIMYFSSPESFGNAKGNNLKIYISKLTDAGWSSPTLHPLCSGEWDYTHPFYDASQKLLVFSSNKSGGYGKMDIWFSYRTETGWTDPVNPGMMVNSSENEVFPTVYDGDIFYSSDADGGKGGFDLKKALQSQQWQSSVTLGEPFNSPSDDLSLFFLNQDKGFLTSNRPGGMGGDDIYVIERIIEEKEKVKFSARIEYEGNPLPAATIIATNELAELVMKEVSDEEGKVNLTSLRYQQNYRLQLWGVDVSKYPKTVLVLLDEDGNKIREIRFNVHGWAELELLPLSYSDLKLLPMEDESILTLNFEGQLYDETPGDIGRNEPVTILDENGNPVAIAYTNDVGKFRFMKVEPRTDYVFQLSKETMATNVLITDKGDRITLPVLNAEIHYMRVDPKDAIELTNEYNERIVVSPKDIFVINRIYYEYGSCELTAESRGQMDQIGILLERNSGIGLELRSHTDSRGQDAFNLALSERRAQTAVKYLKEKGLSTSRFKAHGYGETQLLNECDDGMNCSEPEHSINRRTEIKLVKIQ